MSLYNTNPEAILKWIESELLYIDKVIIDLRKNEELNIRSITYFLGKSGAFYDIRQYINNSKLGRF